MAGSEQARSRSNRADPKAESPAFIRLFRHGEVCNHSRRILLWVEMPREASFRLCAKGSSWWPSGSSAAKAETRLPRTSRAKSKFSDAGQQDVLINALKRLRGGKHESGVYWSWCIGRHLARNLLKHGHHVAIWGRSAGPVDELVAREAAVCASAKEAFSGDAFISMLSDDDAVRDVILDGDVLPRDGSSTIHINMATICRVAKTRGSTWEP